MNPALIILIIIGVIILWFLIAKLFKPIGNIVYKVGNNAIETMKKDTDKKVNILTDVNENNPKMD